VIDPVPYVSGFAKTLNYAKPVGLGLFDEKDRLHTFVLTKTTKEVSEKRKKKMPDGIKARNLQRVKASLVLQGRDFIQTQRYSMPFREQ
jgi:hypothetical protein